MEQLWSLLESGVIQGMFRMLESQTWENVEHVTAKFNAVENCTRLNFSRRIQNFSSEVMFSFS